MPGDKWDQYAEGSTAVKDKWDDYAEPYKMQHSDAERSAAASSSPPAIAKPSVPMHPSYLIGDPNADATPQSIGEVAKGMARNVYQVSAPGIAASLAHKFAPGALSKSGIPHGESLERNATPLKELPGQIVENAAYAAIPEGGAEAEGEKAATPRGRTVPKPPTSDLDAESQAKYTSDLDKANADFKAQARKYHEGVTKAFDESKREQLESQTQHDAAIKKAADDARQQAQDYHEKLSGTFDKAKREQLDAAAKYHTERAQWLDKSRKFHQAQAEAESVTQKRQQLQQSSKAAVKQTYDNLQQTYKAARGSLDQRWGQFRQQMTGQELDPIRSYADIDHARTEFLKGSPASLKVFNDLVREMGIQNIDENGAPITFKGENGEPVDPKLDFDTARVHYSAIGSKLSQGDLPGNVYQALKSVHNALDEQLSDAAQTRGLGKEYTELKSDEHQFLSDWDDTASPLAKAHKALDSNFLEPHVMGRGNEYITKQLERYRKYGADPSLPQAARQAATEAKALPDVKVPKDPGPEPTLPENIPEGAVPRHARPATVPDPPGVPEKAMPKSPELQAVERPKPKAQGKGTGRLARAVRRGGMKLVGGHVAGFPGYIAAGEADSALEEAIKKRRGTVPPPPDE